MRLNLNDIVGIPGAKKPFQFSLPLLDTPACTMCGPASISGQVVNVAGALEVRGEIAVAMDCSCDRCAVHFRTEKSLPVTAYLAETLTDEEHSDIFLLEGGLVDLEEIFSTAFFLELESKIVCGDDCLGLCVNCGARLNEGSCGCKRDIDPRLAALQQLLDK